MDASIRDDRFHQNGDVRQHLRAKVAGVGGGEREMPKPQAHEEVVTAPGRGVQAGKQRDGPPDWTRHREGSKGLKKKKNNFLGFGSPPTGPGVRGSEIAGCGALFAARGTKL